MASKIILAAAFTLVGPLFAGTWAMAQEGLVWQTNREAAQEYDAGVEALHDFWYEEARERFAAAAIADPNFPLAAWGNAMTHFYVWGMSQSRTDRMIEALVTLGTTREERLSKARSDRERRYLRAIEELIADDDEAVRRRKFSVAMGQLATAYPQDIEASAFYAFSLLGAVQSLRRDPLIREEAVRVAERVLEMDSTHHGGLHYMIHVLDSPSNARRALPYANLYDSLEPSAPHAIHMPAHIFMQLGMWEDVVRVNRAGFDRSHELAVANGTALDGRDYHALGWVPYAYLQMGRTEEAWELVAEMDSLARATDSGNFRWWNGIWTATYAIETGVVLDSLPVSGYNSRTEFLGTGINALRQGDLTRAAAMLDKIEAAEASSIESLGSGTTASLRWTVTRLSLQGLLEAARGDTTLALATLTRAVEADEAIGPPNETPDPIKPPSELLGEMQLAAGRSDEASETFARALTARPGRRAALVGAIRAAELAGDEWLAAKYREGLQRPR